MSDEQIALDPKPIAKDGLASEDGPAAPKPFDGTGEDLKPLTEAELDLIAQLRSDGSADLSSRSKDDQRIRAELVRALMLGINEAEWGVALSRILITSAQIDGQLDLITLRRQYSHDRPLPPTSFVRCRFNDNIYLIGACIESLELDDCDAIALNAKDARILGSLILTDSRFEGIIDISNSRVDGNVDLSVTSTFKLNAIDIEVRKAMILSGAEIRGGGLSLNGGQIGYLIARSLGGRGLVVYGEMDLRVLQVESVELTRATLSNKRGFALTCGRMSVRDNLFIGERRETTNKNLLLFDGLVEFRGVRIGNYSRITHCDFRIASEPDWDVTAFARATCLDLRDIVASSGLELSHCTYDGAVTLKGAKLKELVFDETAWPRAGQLDIDQLEYEALDLPRAGVSVSPKENAQRWVEGSRPLHAILSNGAGKVRRVRSNSALHFSAQPYEQLSRTLRRAGYNREADAVAVAKRRRRIKCGVDGLGSQLLGRLMDLVSGFGFSASRALFTIGLLVVAGGVALTGLLSAGLIAFAPQETVSLTEAPPTSYPWAISFKALTEQFHGPTWPLKLGGGGIVVAHGCPSLNPGVYALDLIIPLLDLGQESACRMEVEGWTGGLIQAGRAIYQIAGALMSALLITILTGVLRRD